MPFALDSNGYIRHWLIAPVSTVAYDGPALPEGQLRKLTHVDPVGSPPVSAILDDPGPNGEPWRFYDPGQNIFVEQSSFWHNLSVLDFYGLTRITVEESGTYSARYWSCGVGDLWLNETHVVRNLGTRYMYPDPVDITLELQAGVNTLGARVQALGIRDTRLLFGLQVLNANDDISVDPPAVTLDELQQASEWLDSVRIDSPTRLAATGSPPTSSTVQFGKNEHQWSAGDSFDLAGNDWRVDVTMSISGQHLTRKLEIPASRPIRLTDTSSVDEARKAYIAGLASREGKGRNGVMNVLARHAIGQRGETDTSIIEEACDWVDDRPDCADFPLSALLRLYKGTTLTDGERDRIKQTVIGFRYWHDEPGNDALCFDSENHSLLFHGCQMIAGDLFAEETFTNSDRTGAEQARIGRERIAAWLEEKTANGFHEFLSSTYIPLTVGALLNIVDFADDDEMSNAAGALIDRLYTVIAEHAFDGVTVGPQGRVYRNVLTPDASGTQAMLAYTTPNAITASNDWISFLGASEGYAPPENLAEVMSAPVSKTYSEANVEITIEKTSEFLLTSLQVPASWQKPGSEIDPPYAAKGLVPGRQGYQQHLWHATLGRDCHVFVNHPGATFDLSSSRPGFWYGNGFLPRTAQKDNVLAQVFDTPVDHPVPFTHAHWPVDALDESELSSHWAFGRKGSGCIALWCSSELSQRSEVLTDHELRAEGRKVAWMCFCGSGDLAAFKTQCQAANPSFDEASMTLSWSESSLQF